MEEKEEIKLLKKASKLEKASKKYHNRILRRNDILDFMDEISPEGYKGPIDTKVYGLLRSDEFDDQLMRAKYRGGIEKVSLVLLATASFLLDTLCLPITLTAGLIMNTLKYTGLFGAIRKGIKRGTRKIWDKKAKADEKLYKHLEENDLIDKEWFEHFGSIKTKNWDKYFKWNSRYSKNEPFLTDYDIHDIANLKKSKGDMAGYDKYNELYKIAEDNERFGCDRWMEEKRKKEMGIVNNDAKISKPETKEEEFNKIVDACKKSGMSDEETLKVLEESGFSKVSSKSDVKTEIITVKEEDESLKF